MGYLAGLCLAVVFIAGAFAPSARADGPGLVFPADRSLLTERVVRVVGLAPEGFEHVSVEVEGGKSLDGSVLSVLQGAFSFRVKLDKGENVISLLAADGSVASRLTVAYARSFGDGPEGFVPYFMHGEEDLTGQCDQCHLFRRRGPPTYNRLSPVSNCSTAECHAGFASAKFLHGPVGSGSCTGCHNPHGSPASSFLTRTGADLCFACHSDAQERFAATVVHGPVEVGECLTCHDPHQSDLKFQLRGPSQQALCNGCHGEERSSFKHLHGPVGTGNCVACHSPHASENEALLYRSKDALCFMCHEERREEFARRSVHQPVTEGCGVCHDPHGSNTRQQLRGELTVTAFGQTAACLTCHSKLNPELTGQILNAKVPHKPVQEGNCTACHTPHASDYTFQLKAPLNEICFTCHLDMGDRVAESQFKHGPVDGNDCASCHSVHGGEFANLLINDFPSEFYTRYEDSKYGICFNCHNEKVALDKWSKETQFRNGNLNLHYLHVNREKGRSCKACHEVHAGEQDRHVREEIPFGTVGWSYPIDYTISTTGGTCVVGCHRPLSYDRENRIKQ